MGREKPNGWFSRWFASRPEARDRRDEAVLRFFATRPRLRRVLLGVGFLGLVITIWLTSRFDPLAHIPIKMNRASAIQAARRAALARGFEVAGWNVYATLQPEPSQLRVKTLHPEVVSPLDRLAPPMALHVLFWNSKIPQKLTILLSPNGEEIGFAFVSPRPNNAPPGDPRRDAMLAEAAFQKRFPGPLGARLKLGADAAAEGESLGVDEVPVKRIDPSALAGSRFVWNGQVAGKPAAFLVTVAGGRIVKESFVLKQTESAADLEQIGGWLGLVRCLLIGLIWVGAVIFGLFRLGFRLREKEVAYRRALLLVALAVVCALYAGWITDATVLKQANQQSDLIAIWILNLVGFLFLGLVGALIWAAGEGDLREALPGAVTSFDALLKRKFLSRNVGRSLLVGMGATGLYALASMFLDGLGRWFGWAVPIRFDAVALLIQERWSGAHLLLAPITVVIAAILFLLMLPFSFRLARGARKGLPLFALILMLSYSPVMEAGQGFNTAPAMALASGLLLGLASVLALWWGDLLAALVFYQLSDLPRVIGIAFSPGNELLQPAGVVMSVELLAVALLAGIAARWGRAWREEEVRPLHARHMAERKRLKAEFELARVTRASLMPPSLTAPKGLNVADWVLPSSEIGGDYRDAFTLPDGRWGWVVADSGGRGTGAAIAMALTKGLLLACARRNLSAAQSVERVEQGLEQALGSSALAGFAYGLHDLGRQEVAIARFGGPFPRLCWQRGRDAGWQTVDEPFAVLPFPAGSALACWTDGAELATDPWGMPVGEKTLLAALPKSPETAGQVIKGLERALKRKVGRLRDASGRDEIAVVALLAVPVGEVG